MPAVLEFKSIRKQFPGVVALKDVSLTLEGGRVHGLVGENGAGKSTLLKILSGAYAPTSGRLVLEGNECRFASTREAIDAGVAVIYQELNVVPAMTVEENLLLGHIPQKHGFIDKKQMRKKAVAALATLGCDIDPRTKVKDLSIGQRQLLEITKALLRDAKIIAFDEPTSSLSEWEADRLFQVIRELKSNGRVIIYVSHRLAEVFSICDSVTVFRDGCRIETFSDLKNIDEETLVSKMVGRAISDIYSYSPRPYGPEMLRVEDLMGTGLSQPCSFSVREGEILAFFGLVGAGRSELMKLIYGATKAKSGKIYINGKTVQIDSISDAIRNGIVLCPEDRKYEGIIPIRNVKENINIARRKDFSHFGFFLDNKRETDNANHFVGKLNIKTPTIQQLAINLSGGNQQKVILARWLEKNINVILLDEPTRGIDVGAKNEFYQIIKDLAAQGMAVVVVSSELPEVLGISDRVIVMREGAIVVSVDRKDANEEKLLKHALPASAC